MEGIERGGLPPSPTKTKPGLELLGIFILTRLLLYVKPDPLICEA